MQVTVLPYILGLQSVRVLATILSKAGFFSSLIDFFKVLTFSAALILTVNISCSVTQNKTVKCKDLGAGTRHFY